MVDISGQHPPAVAVAPQRRGDRQRRAIVRAVRELLEQQPFAALSVSAISDRAGVARSGFYFYFDSKYAVLAQIMAEAQQELEELTEHFAPRGPGESPAVFAARMVGSAAAVFAHHDPVMAACIAARGTDPQIQALLDAQIDAVVERIVAVVGAEIAAGTAHPISGDIATLVRTLAATTAFQLSGESSFRSAHDDPARGVAVLEALWRHALWGGTGSVG